MAIQRFNNFGGGACIPLSVATFTAAVGNTNTICVDQTFTASYGPVNATTPVTYLWSIDGLQSGQGTPVAVYQWTATCNKSVTVTISNACSSVSHTDNLTLSLTLMQIAEAIKNTIANAMTPTLLARAYGYDHLPEGVNDAPSLMVYWQSVVNDKYTDTDRTTFGGVRVKEFMFRVDYYQNPRNNMEENNAKLTYGAVEIIDILEQQALGCTPGGGHCPPFGLCGLKTFRWSGERVTFDYGSVRYYGARFEIVVRVF
jgi:hypothetical protein